MCRLAKAPPTPFIDGRKSVASRAHTNARATTERAEILRSGKLPAPSRHRSRLLSQTVRRLAQAPPTPFIDGRKSVASRAHTNMRANPEGAEILRSGPVNACPVAPSLSDTSPDHVPARESTSGPVHRWSKIGRVARPHQCACNDREGRNPTVRQTAFVCHWQLSLRFLHSSGYQVGTKGVTNPVPQAGPSRRPRCRHRAHGTPAAHRRRRSAHRSGRSRSAAPAVLLVLS
jgi:hypothetical protein